MRTLLSDLSKPTLMKKQRKAVLQFYDVNNVYQFIDYIKNKNDSEINAFIPIKEVQSQNEFAFEKEQRESGSILAEKNQNELKISENKRLVENEGEPDLLNPQNI